MDNTILQIRRSILQEAEERYYALLQLRHVSEAERVLLDQKRAQTHTMLLQLADPPAARPAKPQPPGGLISEAEARTLLLVAEGHALEEVFARRVEKPWTWDTTRAGWTILDDDCLILPGVNGVVVIEAASDGGGLVLALNPDDSAAIAAFPIGTFQ